MRQVLFYIPIPNPWNAQGIPIYGFGAMLVLALVLCTLLTTRRARKAGIAPEHIQDLAFWLVICGILGARIVFMIQYGQPLSHFLNFWEGGLVFYGALLGGAVGLGLGYVFIMRKHGISGWKLADVVAPALALGLCVGRFGCLLNGCCYGDVACPECVSIHFPAHSFSWRPLVEKGTQAAAGFTFTEDETGCTVRDVDASSEAARAGLRPGDVIVKADGHDIPGAGHFSLAGHLLGDEAHWQHGAGSLALSVRRGGEVIDLPPFRPRTLGLYPTQLFESVSAFLILLVLLAYTPLRRRDGEVALLFLTLYPIHRFLNEMLRHDTDPVAFGLTLSQNGSILILAVALVLWVWLLRKPAQYQPLEEKKEPVAVSAA